MGIAIHSYEGFPENLHTKYNYAVPIDTARNRRYSSETQAEIKELAEKRHRFDETLYDLHPDNVGLSDPLHSDNITPESRRIWAFALQRLMDRNASLPPSPVPEFPYRQDVPTETTRLRKRSRTYFRELIDRGILGDPSTVFPENIDHLKNDLSSAGYWIYADDGTRMMRFSHGGIQAETEVLSAGRAHGVQFPEVKTIGTIISRIDPLKSVQYMLMEGITNNRGEKAETLSAITIEDPYLLEAAADDSGSELAKLHRTPNPYTHFGNFHDGRVRVGQQKYDIIPQSSWDKFLINVVRPRLHVLQKSGYLQELSEHSINAYFDTLRDLPQVPGYVHGDFDANKVLISSHNPNTVKTTLFGPTPFIGSRYWDLAYLEHQLDYAKLDEENGNVRTDYYERKVFYDCFFMGYEKEFGEPTDPDVLLATKFAIAICATDDFVKRGEIERARMTQQLVYRYGQSLAAQHSLSESE